MLSKKGRIVLDVIPSKVNPRNSEGAFIDLNDGRIMFTYSYYTGDSWSDDAKACIAVMYSSDEGESWGEKRTLFTPEEHGAVNLMSTSMLRMGNGDVGLFYMVRKNINDLLLYFVRSSDEGKTWSEPTCCIPKPGYYVTNNDRVVRLSSGRIVIPAALRRHRGGDLFQANGGQNDVKGIVHFIYSDDDGLSWNMSEHFSSIMVAHSRSGLQEPGVVELKNGVLWSWSRTDLGRQYEMFSVDQGETWSEPVPSQFTSPNSPLSMKRIPLNNQLLAIWNPIPNYETRAIEKHSWGRVPLIGALSHDEGKTWGNYFYVETEEDRGGYCYTSIHFTSNAVLLAYCAGEEEDGGCLARLRIRKIHLEDL